LIKGKLAWFDLYQAEVLLDRREAEARSASAPCRPAGASPIKENFGLIEIKPR
jgi:hypothetical protein